MKEAQVSLKLQFMDHFTYEKRIMFQNFVHPTAVKGRKDFQLCESSPSSDSSHVLPS